MRCKLGKLAFIKKAVRPVNIGKIVTCKESLGFIDGGVFYTHNGETWMSIESDYYWVISCPSGLETLFGKSQEAHIADSWLSPIDDLPPEQDEDTKIVDLVDDLIV